MRVRPSEGRYHSSAMGARTAASSRRSRRAAARGADPASAQLLGEVARAQPRFWLAVHADAQIAARFRGERTRFRGRLDAVIQVMRLCWQTESFFALVCYRARVALRLRGVVVVPGLLHHLSVMSGQLSIGDYAVLRPGIYLPHGQVVIDGLTLVGSGTVLRPFVTLGLVDGHPMGPRLGDRVRVGTGAKVLGPVTVGSDVQIGANAVVLDDVPDGATAVGVPARVRA
jgi:serine O-acetyltransferase